jgi:hypothetical protein
LRTGKRSDITAKPSHRCHPEEVQALALRGHAKRRTYAIRAQLRNSIVILNQRSLRREGSGRAARRVTFFVTHYSRVWLAPLSTLPAGVPGNLKTVPSPTNHSPAIPKQTLQNPKINRDNPNQPPRLSANSRLNRHLHPLAVTRTPFTASTRNPGQKDCASAGSLVAFLGPQNKRILCGRCSD